MKTTTYWIDAARVPYMVDPNGNPQDSWERIGEKEYEGRCAELEAEFQAILDAQAEQLAADQKVHFEALVAINVPADAASRLSGHKV